MPASPEQQVFATHVVDLLAGFGPCEGRRMFGGVGIFHQGLMFALIDDGHLYLKADDDNRDQFEHRDCSLFTYYKQGKPCHLSYYQAPEDFFEDADACRRWAQTAFDAALRAARKKKPKKTAS